RNNLLLKMTSLNAGVIGMRLVISFFIQRMLAEIVGEAGIAKIGSLRNLLEMLSSFASVGIFSGVVKYVAEYKDDKEQLQKLFSTTFVFTTFGSIAVFFVLFFASTYLSVTLFVSLDYVYLIKLLAIIVMCISVYRVFNAVVSGLSQYTQLAGIDIFPYLLCASLTVILLLTNTLDGALIAIAITPPLQFIVLLLILVKVLRVYIHLSKLSFQ